MMRRIRWVAPIVSVATTMGTLAAFCATPAAASPSHRTARSVKPAAGHAAKPSPQDFGPHAASSNDVAVSGFGDPHGYHVRVAAEKSGFAWRDVAVLDPDGIDVQNWFGYQCVSGDGKYAAVAVLPGPAVNVPAARDRGAFAYSVDLRSGKVRPVASGVALKYYTPSCGVGDTAVFTLNLGRDQQTTELLTADLASGKVTDKSVVAGQVTSAVPTQHGLIGAAGSSLVAVPAGGSPKRPGKVHRVASVHGTPFELRARSGGGVDFLTTTGRSKTTTAHRERGGKITKLGSGPKSKVQLFAGRGGHNTLVGATHVAKGSGLRAVAAKALPSQAQSASVNGDAVFAPAHTKPDQVARDKKAPAVDSTAGKRKVAVASATRKLVHTTAASAATPASPTTAVSGFVPPGVHGSAGPDAGAQPSLQPKASLKPKSSKKQSAKQQSVTPDSSGQPKCSVPRLDAHRQVMQPSNTQVDWAAQMAERGLLTGSQYQRPSNFANMGLAAYSPNNDFPRIPLKHPSGGSWDTVPRSVFEAILAQESNWNQASWHALPGIAGDPLIADYYGAAGTITTINYPAADCGYGIAQVTDGMATNDTSLTHHGQMKVAVDYQENIAAGLQIIEQDWNQLYDEGIIANNGDPKYLENWYFAAWAYNTGIEPTARFGNTTGCTPGPNCTGKDGTWGLGWTNNPKNPDYPPNRDPYLQDTYADAAHPSDWAYQERIMGWMASPLIRYHYYGYDPPTYHGGHSWIQLPGINSFCDSSNKCDVNYHNQSNPGASYCTLSDFQCWWHKPVTWVSNCAQNCATSVYQYANGSSEPSYGDPHPPTCALNHQIVPQGAIIVDDEPSPVNLVGCGAPNWSQGGTFSYHYGTNQAGQPIGAIDTHQLGAGFGGRVLFSHTESGNNPALINTATWTPNLPSTQYYKIKIHFPATGAAATNVVYKIYPGGGKAPFKYRVNQDWGSEQWATIATVGMQPGGYVTLSNKAPVLNTGGHYSARDVAFDAIAFIPEGGNIGTPIGGPPTVLDEPKGSNPAWVNCGCVQRTAGDPVNTQTGYFGDTFTDLSTPGRGMALKLSRTYDSALADPNGPHGKAALNSGFGHGWTFSYNLSAVTDSSGNVVIHQEDGSQVPFTKTKNGGYTVTEPRDDATLTKTGSQYVYTRRGKKIYTFDVSTGRLTAETTLAGSVASPAYATHLSYDSKGKLTTVTDPEGRKYSFTWSNGHITQVTDDTGREVDYGYNSAGDLTDVWGVTTDRSHGGRADNDHTQYGYNSAHLMTSMRSPDNFGKGPDVVTAMSYDSAQRVTAQTDPLGRKTSFTYGPDGGLKAGQTLVTDPAGHKTLDNYNAAGLLTSETKGYGTPAAGTWRYTYDPITLGVATKTDPDGNVTTYSYDKHGNMISKSSPRGFTTSYRYDDHGDLLQTTDPDGIQTTYTYNKAGAHTKKTVSQPGETAESPGGNPPDATVRTTTYGYADQAHPADQTSTTDPNGHTSKTSYDTYGDVVSRTDPAGRVTKYGWDTARGLRTSKVGPAGTAAGVTPGCAPPTTGCTTYSYDAAGHNTKTTGPLGHTHRQTYDADGNEVSSTDGDGNTTTYTYDAADQKVKTTTADGTVTATGYTPDGQVASIINGQGGKTSYSYDAQGHRTQATDPDGRTTVTAYDPAGRVTKTIAPGGTSVSYSYDPDGQVIKKSYSDNTPTVSGITYDPDGNRLTVTDGSGTSSWTYNSFGEIHSHTAGSDKTVTYGHDKDGHVTSITYPGHSHAVTRGFTQAGEMASVTDFAGNKTTFSYGQGGRLATTHYPNGTSVTRSRDKAGQLSATALMKGSARLASLSYTRDANAQVTGHTPTGLPGEKHTYSYTKRNQLASATTSSTSSPYAYDKASDPTTVAGTQQTYDTASQLCWINTGATVSTPSCSSPPNGATTFSYNKNGERTNRTTGTGDKSTYTYNAPGRLTSATTPHGNASYGYDGHGLRVSRTSGTTTHTWTWDNAATPDLLSDGTHTFIYGPGGLPIEQITGTTILWFFHDHIGSTRALTDNTGTLAGAYDYTPYGHVRKHTGTATTPLQYTSGHTDPLTGFVYLRARLYDPATAQFLTQDPAFNNTGQYYAYANNNPLNNIDPTGRFFGLSLVGAVVGGIAGGVGAIIGGAIRGHIDWGDVGIAAGVGAITGAAAGLCGFCAGAVAGAATDFLTQAHHNNWNLGNTNWPEVAGEGLIGGIGGAFGDVPRFYGRAGGYSSEYSAHVGMILSPVTALPTVAVTGFDPLYALTHHCGH